MYKASCLCGTVKLQIEGSITDIIHCHCSKCRKASGTAYATNGFVLKADLTIQQGQDNLQSYSATPGSQRYFCATCATTLYSETAADPMRVRFRLGVLDTDISERPGSHNFVTSKANWEQFNDRLPHYKGREPNRSKPPQA